MNKILGLAGSMGYALGFVKIVEHPKLDIHTTHINADEIENEIQNFLSAKKKVIIYLRDIYNNLIKEKKEENALIFDGHIALLDDEDLDKSVIKIIKEESRHSSFAVDSFFESCAIDMEELDDQYLKERASDFRDLKRKVIYAMYGISLSIEEDLPQNTVVIAKDLSPSDTAAMDSKKVVGFVLEGGGATSHVIIYAKNLGLPAVISASNITQLVKNGDLIAMSGASGEVVINPDEKTITEYKNFIDLEKKRIQTLKTNVLKEAITLDGYKMGVYANIGGLADLERAIKNGCEGVGLFRTEFLYNDLPQAPSEEELFDVFKTAAQMLDGKPLVIRTLDCGGDKPLSYVDFGHEDNPFLGYRGIRIYKENYQMFKTQMRAAFCASYYGNVKVMYPMVMSIKELRWLNRQAELIKQELITAGEKIDVDMITGIMIETPAAVFIADRLAKETSFFSIGSNDMTQYMLAVDRGNERIAQLYNSFYLSILRAIKIVCEAARDANIEVALCGEFGGDLHAIPILMAFGMNEVSISGANALMEVKGLIRSITLRDAKKFTDEVMALSTIEEVLNHTNKWLDKNWH